jgi:hypothetical protein
MMDIGHLRRLSPNYAFSFNGLLNVHVSATLNVSGEEIVYSLIVKPGVEFLWTEADKLYTLIFKETHKAEDDLRSVLSADLRIYSYTNSETIEESLVIS